MTDPVKIIVGEGDITEVQVPEYNLIQTGGGGSGSDGATFFPEVSQEGVISWTNDGGYDNPEPVNIKGPDGNDGSDGEDGEDGVSPVVTFGEITGGHTMTVTDKTHPTGQTINIMDGTQGQTGPAGPGVPAGGNTGQVLAKKSNADNDTEWVNQSGGGGGTSDYDDLTDKPSINGTTLSGNKTAADLGLGTYSKPSTGIPQTDLASAVQNKLDKTVVVSDTQPASTASENKLWVDTDAGTGSSYQIPTVAEMEAADAQVAAEIGIVITGKRPSMAVTAGQFVIVRNSTISGISDGLYTANAALSPSTDVTAANLTAVSGGGLNNFASYYDNYNNPTLTTNSDAGLTTNSSTVRRKGNLVLLYVNVRNLNGFTAETWTTIHTLNVYPNTTISASCAFQGQTATLRLNTNGTVQIYPHGSAFTLFARVIIPFFV